MHTVPLTSNSSVHTCPLASDSKATCMCMFANSCVRVYLHVSYTHAMRVKHLCITKINTSRSHDVIVIFECTMCACASARTHASDS